MTKFYKHSAPMEPGKAGLLTELTARVPAQTVRTSSEFVLKM
mgnify:FL=1